jgi:hypothetical protein
MQDAERWRWYGLRLSPSRRCRWFDRYSSRALRQKNTAYHVSCLSLFWKTFLLSFEGSRLRPLLNDESIMVSSNSNDDLTHVVSRFCVRFCGSRHRVVLSRERCRATLRPMVIVKLVVGTIMVMHLALGSIMVPTLGMYISSQSGGKARV